MKCIGSSSSQLRTLNLRCEARSRGRWGGGGGGVLLWEIGDRITIDDETGEAHPGKVRRERRGTKGPLGKIFPGGLP